MRGLALLLFLLIALPSAAQEPTFVNLDRIQAALEVPGLSYQGDFPVAPDEVELETSPPEKVSGREAFTWMSRAAFGMHLLEGHSTWYSVTSGNGREANPLMRPFASDLERILAVKAGVASVLMWLKEGLYRDSPRSAWIAAIAEISILAAVSGWNYSVGTGAFGDGVR